MWTLVCLAKLLSSFPLSAEEVEKRKSNACHQTCLHDSHLAVSLFFLSTWAFTRSFSEEPLNVSTAFQQNTEQFLMFSAKKKRQGKKNNDNKENISYSKTNFHFLSDCFVERWKCYVIAVCKKQLRPLFPHKLLQQ